ncbi:hypothetical protein [Microbacterium phyllosphaerae]|uniref:hypothetical protein n=1 Tax=Microbacterium phyllosphaerae TaxID=124798 RepID=UPI0011AE1971|nr:hypothetical protein [Microbacterium phyllosphaerae]
MTTRAVVEAGLASGGVPQALVTESLDAFEGAKRRFFLGDYRPQAVDGGRFSEAVGRIVEFATTGAFTPLTSNTFNMDQTIKNAEKTQASSASDSMRLHIPRTLKLIYDIRNRRNTAHLRDGIDPNLQDATLIVHNMNWVLAELVREYHNVPAAAAQALIEELVAREVPMIQEFDGRPRLLKTMTAGDHVLVLLYWANRRLTKAELAAWAPDKMRANIARTLKRLHDLHLVEFTSDSAQITMLGVRKVESEGLVGPV